MLSDVDALYDGPPAEGATGSRWSPPRRTWRT